MDKEGSRDDNTSAECDAIFDAVDRLPGEEAKALLKRMYARLDMQKNGFGNYKEKACINDMMEAFIDLPRIIRKLKR
ncbi:MULTISPECIES: hypothetical protein [Bacillus]|uniref:hypothetical protein n=2 Tax=Bacillus TaxID=1386 RepID=UPI0022438344|nr:MULTISPECIES: hypothetical protein [Bacillus]MDN5386288.1 hypothetical protein [Bacillus sp. LB7]MEC1020473.1 hypothetical protein [Bacillus paralicheniformis]MEC1027718.1 hypothetical protein [Bacillus paralicheniformis]MEC1036602.1 hypothetical protein [Bacillus paralicheniformis]MEC1052951.1 hypothetical protein [Bacillus paralicheniformis]